MSFTDRFDPIPHHTSEQTPLILWLKTFGFSIGLYFGLVLLLIKQRHLVGFDLINVSTAWMAVILIGLSMVLSAFCYFWDAFDHYVLFRKYLGVSGFIFACIHAFFSLVIMRSDFPFPAYYLDQKNIVSFIFAVMAFVYFAFMTSISNTYSVLEIGGVRWRKLLRVGYIAYIFSIIHFGLKGLPYWTKWIQNGMKTPPSIGLVLFIFAIFVPYFRVILEIALRQQKKSLPHETL